MQEHTFQMDKPINKNEVFKSAFNTGQNLDSTLYYRWNSTTEQWDFNSKTNYDENGNETLFINSYIETDGKITYYKKEYEYNNSGDDSLCIKYKLDDITGQWVKQDIVEFEYDKNGNFSNFLFSIWDIANSQFKISQKYDFEYDENNNKTLSIFYFWDSTTSQWKGSSKKEYDYDNYGNNTTLIDYMWDRYSNQWLFLNKYVYEYDSSGNQILYIKYNWDKVFDRLNNSVFFQRNENLKTKNEYEFDGNGNQTLKIVYNWNWDTGQWYGHNRKEFEYDSLDNQTLIKEYQADRSDPSKWRDYLVTKYEYEYDENGNMLSRIEYMSGYFNVTKFTKFSKYIYYYSEKNANNVNDFETGTVRVFPNPFSQHITVGSNGNNNQLFFELFDLQGRKIISRSVIRSEKISIENLKKGVYL